MKTLSRVRCYVGKNTALYLYGTLISPLFNFNNYVYDNLSATDNNKLQVIQNNCIRICLKANRTTPREVLYAQSRTCPLSTQQCESTTGIVYLGLNKLSTPFVNNLFTKVESKNQRVLRSEFKGDVMVPCTKLETVRGNIRYRGPLYYNKIGPDVHTAKTYKTFKRRLKKTNIFSWRSGT